MTECTLAEALAAMQDYGSAVHCEMAENYERYYDESDEDRQRFYKENGCIVVHNDYKYNGRMWLWRQLHQVSPEADMPVIIEKYRAELVALRQKYENPAGNLMVFTVKEKLTDDEEARSGWHNFVRVGKIGEPDPRVRKLTPTDAGLLQAACAPSLESDTSFGKWEAEAFANYDFADMEKIEVPYGIFENGELAGVATVSYNQSLNLAWLRRIFISIKYRRQGMGRALLHTLTNLYPDKKWHYQAARNNEPSIALAASVGFTQEGAVVYWD